MKIKTITCHNVYNYGASLQAYALQEYLLSLGHDVEIIDYRPDYMRVHYDFWYVPKSSHYYNRAMKSKFFRFLLCCYFARKRYATYGRKLKFDIFTRKYLHLTKRYLSYQDLIVSPPDADIYIAGSDQIWNCALPNGRDAAYFLQFGIGKIKRISYAASFAIPEIPETYKETVKEWLRSFDAISVRERTGLKILESICKKGVEVLDPVFLLEKSDWVKFSNEGKVRIKNKYILVYDLYVNDGRLEQEAKRLSSKYNLEIVAVDALIKCQYAKKNISNAGPQEFVRLVAGAEYVVTNSFHATAFSIIFNRPFAVYYNYSNISRISDILSILGLNNRLNSDLPDYDVNWQDVNILLEHTREKSIHFIASNLD